MGPPPLVADVPPQFEEIENVIVPGLEIGTAGPAPLAALIDGDQLVVVHLEKGDDPLALAVGALDIASGSPDRRPRTAETAGPFREHGIFGDSPLHDRLDRVVDFVEITGRQLRMHRA